MDVDFTYPTRPGVQVLRGMDLQVRRLYMTLFDFGTYPFHREDVPYKYILATYKSNNRQR